MVSYVKAVAGASAIASLLPALAAYAQPAPTTGGTYYHALEAAVTCIDPPTQIFHVALNVGRQLVDSLVDQDPQTGAIVPWIAERWDISEDAQTFTFHLRQGSHFADGAPIDAAAVQANIDRIAALGPRAVGAAPLLIGYTGTEVIDPQTVRITFDRPAVQFLQALSGAWFGLISPNDLGKSADALCAGDFAGSGPFITASYQGDTEIVLQRRDGYDQPFQPGGPHRRRLCRCAASGRDPRGRQPRRRRPDGRSAFGIEYRLPTCAAAGTAGPDAAVTAYPRHDGIADLQPRDRHRPR
ncbi:ABC-type dipeptide transport system, periplasmic component (plasmid) [Ketogulonicigenium vulgare Y25]|nr:ABC-type dipeptide transport system, periplasmic component [Ketogulonicigenium vulgare Y25]